MKSSPHLPSHLDLTEHKYFSTYECICINDDLSCPGECFNCWDWEMLDFDESLRGWFTRSRLESGDTTFVVENAVRHDRDSNPSSFYRGTHLVNAKSPVELLEALIDEGDDQTIVYKTPELDDFAWEFWQFSAYYPLHDKKDVADWELCRVFPFSIDKDYIAEMAWVNSQLEELAQADPFFASLDNNEGGESI